MHVWLAFLIAGTLLLIVSLIRDTEHRVVLLIGCGALIMAIILALAAPTLTLMSFAPGLEWLNTEPIRD